MSATVSGSELAAGPRASPTDDEPTRVERPIARCGARAPPRRPSLLVRSFLSHSRIVTLQAQGATVQLHSLCPRVHPLRVSIPPPSFPLLHSSTHARARTPALLPVDRTPRAGVKLGSTPCQISVTMPPSPRKTSSDRTVHRLGAAAGQVGQQQKPQDSAEADPSKECVDPSLSGCSGA